MSDMNTGPVGGAIYIEETQGLLGEKVKEDVTEPEDETEDDLDADLQANDDITGE